MTDNEAQTRTTMWLPEGWPRAHEKEILLLYLNGSWETLCVVAYDGQPFRVGHFSNGVSAYLDRIDFRYPGPITPAPELAPNDRKPQLYTVVGALKVGATSETAFDTGYLLCIEFKPQTSGEVVLLWNRSPVWEDAGNNLDCTPTEFTPQPLPNGMSFYKATFAPDVHTLMEEKEIVLTNVEQQKVNIHRSQRGLRLGVLSFTPHALHND
jgi:hypothetical protein